MSGSLKRSIFYSYSPFRSETSDITQAVVAVSKEVFRHRGWEIKDPIEEQGTSVINTKVVKALRDSNAILFVWQGVDNSNTGFETGYAAALGHPIIVLKRMDTKALFPDLGNHEYLTHATKVEDFEREQKSFEESLARVLEKLETDQLTPGLLAIRESSIGLFERLKAQIERHRGEDSGALYIESGYINKIGEKFDEGTKFKIESHHYPHCYFELKKWPRHKQIKAIADVSTAGAGFFRSHAASPLNIPIAERTFVFKWKELLGKEGPSFLFDELYIHWKEVNAERAEREKQHEYRILVAAIKDPLFNSSYHPLGKSAIGHDILMIGDNYVAGYVESDDYGRKNTYLKVKKLSDFQQNQVERRFRKVNTLAVEFDPSESPDKLKERLLKKHRVGHWNSSWGACSERPFEYFEKYDQNIKLWMPLYDDIIANCAGLVFREIMKLYDAPDQRPLYVLELGYGSGNLTEKLLNHFGGLNAALRPLLRNPAIGRYFGVDVSRRMYQICEKRFGLITDNKSGFEGGRKEINSVLIELLVSDFMQGTEFQKAHVVFGSFILHFLLGSNPDQGRIEQLAIRLRERLFPGGSMIFAGIFFDDDQGMRNKQIEWWKDEMSKNVEKENVEEFFAANPEITNCLSWQKFSSGLGFFKFDEPRRIGGNLSPFHIVSFRDNDRSTV